jgi:pyruvate dehydrogenase (quinone)
MQTITTIGLDIAKSVFQVHGVDAVAHDGPAVLDVVTATQELSMPPTTTVEQILWVLRAMMSGRGDEVLDSAKTNLLPR